MRVNEGKWKQGVGQYDTSRDSLRQWKARERQWRLGETSEVDRNEGAIQARMAKRATVRWQGVRYLRVSEAKIKEWMSAVTKQPTNGGQLEIHRQLR